MNVIQKKYVEYIRDIGRDLHDAVNEKEPRFNKAVSDMEPIDVEKLDADSAFLFKVWEDSLKLQAYADAVLSGAEYLDGDLPLI